MAKGNEHVRFVYLMHRFAGSHIGFVSWGGGSWMVFLFLRGKRAGGGRGGACHVPLPNRIWPSPTEFGPILEIIKCVDLAILPF